MHIFERGRVSPAFPDQICGGKWDDPAISVLRVDRPLEAQPRCYFQPNRDDYHQRCDNVPA